METKLLSMTMYSFATAKIWMLFCSNSSTLQDGGNVSEKETAEAPGAGSTPAAQHR